MKSIMDSHIHLFAKGYPGRDGVLFPDGHELSVYEKLREEYLIEKALVVGYEGSQWSQGNNQYIAELAKARKWMIPLAFCSLKNPLDSNTLMKYWDEGFYGISLYVFDVSSAEALVLAPDLWVDTLNIRKAIISVNALPEIAGKHLRPVWERLHGCKILFSHMGLPGSIEEGAEKLSPLLDLGDLLHVGIKLSAAYAINAYPHPGLNILLNQIKTAYGEDRLYWGSDFVPALHQVTFQQTVDAILNHPWENPLKIMGENLAAILERSSE